MDVYGHTKSCIQDETFVEQSLSIAARLRLFQDPGAVFKTLHFPCNL